VFTGPSTREFAGQEIQDLVELLLKLTWGANSKFVLELFTLSYQLSEHGCLGQSAITPWEVRVCRQS
jgi:hypothetical protein